MIRPISLLLASLTLSGLLSSPDFAAAQNIQTAADWCRLDDPAYYLGQRQALIDQGQRDLTTISCPELAPASSLPQELALPLPCGRRMVFRRVDIPTETVLDQYLGAFGNIPNPGEENTLMAFSSGPWLGLISGSFSLNADDAPALPDLSDLAARAYYIGKYELTAPQYAAFLDGLLDAPTASDTEKCQSYEQDWEKIKATQVLPATGLSWYSAIDFSRAWNRWLFALDQQRIKQGQEPFLPWEQGHSGYLRLPTETEWEFAARGGIAGSASEDQGRKIHRVLNPASGLAEDASLEQVAIVVKPGSRTLTQGIGRRLPNLLNLYDMLGNVEEITHDLFRATRPDVLHGQIGGYLVRGGSAITSRQALSVGLRREVPLFEFDRGEGDSKLTGVRLVIAAPLFVGGVARQGGRYQTGFQNPAFLNALQNAQFDLIEITGGDSASQELRKELKQLQEDNEKGAITNEQLTAQLAKLEAALSKSEAEQQQANRLELRNKVKTTVMLGNSIRSLGRLASTYLLQRENVLEKIEALKKKTKAGNKDVQALQERTQIYDQQWANMEANINAQFAFFLRNVLELLKAEPEPLQNAIAAVKDEFSAGKINIYDKLWPNLEPQLVELRKKSGQLNEDDRKKWLYLLDDTRDRREKRFNLVIK